MHFSTWKHIIALYVALFLTAEMQLVFKSHFILHFSREWTAFIACRSERKEIHRARGGGPLTVLH